MGGHREGEAQHQAHPEGLPGEQPCDWRDSPSWVRQTWAEGGKGEQRRQRQGERGKGTGGEKGREGRGEEEKESWSRGERAGEEASGLVPWMGDALIWALPACRTQFPHL